MNANDTHFSTIFLTLILLFDEINVCLIILCRFNFQSANL